MSPWASRTWYWLQVIGWDSVGISTIDTHWSTGQTRLQRLHPTQSASRTTGTDLPSMRPGPYPMPVVSGSSRSMH